ncbi:MAG: hydrogenase nickel incorporation protein HypB [Planctomycetes bacterium]|jgi:hydrogenase nickel incorporation protein HypB|nr:hydrogenase nickel incorporation protein HypB [Planctomycetota bacterium]
MKVSLNQKILSRNDQIAQQNREFFAQNGILCLNVISSPGSGKTTLLARTIRYLGDRLKVGVIEGDIRTDHDAQRIRETGAEAVQIETEGACHLSAEQVAAALKVMDAASKDIIFIENVGNLVCPSAFDLGESGRVVLLSVPEGDDKPAKYPGTFAGANIILVNKIDLIDYIPFRLERVLADIQAVNPEATILQVSAETGQGFDAWCDWLVSYRAAVSK